ncbi:hypothetical protein M408DRAFT_330456 [Serendipita vermifera MAFF 305830]|uniref:Uncharacterized protein n=1 Tax=Serendipita vermifera MAFF 305830 TaxID=933852 RepID=A0A0C2WK29_SERVB|nr:hypothetical protein M408DRAFT_330456 [Serendipita vermifera MAFF 305830]
MWRRCLTPHPLFSQKQSSASKAPRDHMENATGSVFWRSEERISETNGTCCSDRLWELLSHCSFASSATPTANTSRRV